MIVRSPNPVVRLKGIQISSLDGLSVPNKQVVQRLQSYNLECELIWREGLIDL